MISSPTSESETHVVYRRRIRGGVTPRKVSSVLIVSQPGSDGVLRHVDLLCRFMIDRGVRLHLAYSDRQSCEQRHALVDHVAANGGRTFNLRTGNAPQLADVGALRGLMDLIREVQPQVIHSHSSKAGGLVRALRLLGVRVPIFYTPHAYYRMHDPQHWKARIFHSAERLLGGAGVTICMGSFESEFARDVLKVPKAKRIIIPNGIDTRSFCPVTPERKRELRVKFGLPVDAPVLGTVGRFSLQKDPETLYAALARLAAHAPDLHFAHLGRGELMPKIDTFLAGQPFASRVKRIEYLADSTEFYQMLDGFALTSRYEGQSYAALEAFACDLPAVLTEAPGNTDLADYGFSQVWRATPGDVDSVAAAMEAWYASLSGPERPNHRQVMLDEFTEEICYSRVLEAYEEAVAKGEGEEAAASLGQVGSSAV